jgi:hypothetical protein
MMKYLTVLFKRAHLFVRSWASRNGQSLKRVWYKHVIGLVALLAAAVLITSVVSKAWRSRDIGSNSWFARAEGNGLELDRGAVTTAAVDKLGDQYSTVIYLSHGWSAGGQSRGLDSELKANAVIRLNATRCDIRLS